MPEEEGGMGSPPLEDDNTAGSAGGVCCATWGGYGSEPLIPIPIPRPPCTPPAYGSPYPAPPYAKPPPGIGTIPPGIPGIGGAYPYPPCAPYECGGKGRGAGPPCCGDGTGGAAAPELPSVNDLQKDSTSDCTCDSVGRGCNCAAVSPCGGPTVGDGNAAAAEVYPPVAVSEEGAWWPGDDGAAPPCA